VSAKERLKAAELIGKRYGLFTDKVELGGAAKVIFEDDLKADDPDE
jgi:phage terminase small subunit